MKPVGMTCCVCMERDTTDDGTPILSSSATITININNVNEQPVVLDYTFSINENAVNGLVVGTVSASCTDEG